MKNGIRRTAAEMQTRLGRLPDAEEVAQEWGLFWFTVADVMPELPKPERYTDSRVRGAVWAKTQGKCWYCGHQTNPFIGFTVDHVEPRVFGGSDDLSNLVPCCERCNSTKRDRHWSVLRVSLYDDPTALLYFETMEREP